MRIYRLILVSCRSLLQPCSRCIKMNLSAACNGGGLNPKPRPPVSWPLAPAVPFKARRTIVSRSCAECRQNKSKCDDARPCSRCVKRSIADSCVDWRRSSSPVPQWRAPVALDETPDRSETDCTTESEDDRDVSRGPSHLVLHAPWSLEQDSRDDKRHVPLQFSTPDLLATTSHNASDRPMVFAVDSDAVTKGDELWSQLAVMDHISANMTYTSDFETYDLLMGEGDF